MNNTIAIAVSPKRARIWFSYKLSCSELTAQNFPFLEEYTLCRFLICMHLVTAKKNRRLNIRVQTKVYKFWSIQLTKHIPAIKLLLLHVQAYSFQIGPKITFSKITCIFYAVLLVYFMLKSGCVINTCAFLFPKPLAENKIPWITNSIVPGKDLMKHINECWVHINRIEYASCHTGRLLLFGFQVVFS